MGNRRLLFRLLGLVFLHVSFSIGASAQLSAGIEADILSGCSPLTVSFTNTTKGASAAARYEWNMGNGQTSDKVNTRAIFTEAKAYTITLKVTDGGQTSTTSIDVTVFKNPTPDFTATPLKACAPALIAFNSTAQAGDGTIDNYFWDFGDGNTESGDTLHSPSHRYTFGQRPPVKLTVRNSHGCYATVEKNNVVEITPGIRVDFAANKTQLCALSDAVAFTPQVSGPGTLNYHWDFGDGQTSEKRVPDPVTYTQKGNYTVTLTVANTEGCTNTLTRTNYIDAANRNPQMALPSALCANQVLNFSNASQPAPAATRWLLDGNIIAEGANASQTFSGPGAYALSMISTFGACKDTLKQVLNIGAPPRVAGFLTDTSGSCQAPLTVQFQDTSTATIARRWTFGTNNPADTSGISNPVFTFDKLGNYHVSLTLTNELGCSATATRNISISKPQISIAYIRSNSPQGNYGCTGTTLTFQASPESAIRSFSWDFGDGTTAATAQPEHRFDKAGNYTITLRYTTAGGCTDSVLYLHYVRISEKPKADFTMIGSQTVCGSTPVQFQDLTDTATQWLWDFGDGTSSNLQNPVHAFGAAGQNTIQLVATNQYCSDTVRKEQFITLQPPFAKINYSKNCTDRGKVTLSQTSDGANSWAWDFGDGTPLQQVTENQPQITHTYTRSGVYRISLLASNETCTSIDTVHVSILVKQNPVLVLDKTALCGSDTLQYTISGMDTIKWYYNYNQQIYNYNYSGWLEYRDGRRHSGSGISFFPPEYTQRLYDFAPGPDSLRLITYDPINYCYDTSNFVGINISGPIAGFRVAQNELCLRTPVVFTDTSKGTGAVPIVQRVWAYGDGNSDTLAAGGRNTHLYLSPGAFRPKLKVVDANGCFAETANNIINLNILGPAVNFTVSDTVVLPNTTVQFQNTSDIWPFYPVTYSWNFGDASPASNQVSPAHTYAQVGEYTVTLMGRSNQGCADTAVKQALVKVKTVKAAFTFTAAYVNNNSCPPLLARFNSTSLNADSLFWSFGDVSYADNEPQPRHTYYQPGVYRVTLYAYNKDAVDSVSQEITVNGPYGTVTPSAVMGCNPTTITLRADARNTRIYTWDFNDGYVAQDTAGAESHEYTRPGVYYPKIILRDAAGCTATLSLQDSIVIDELKGNFAPDTRLVCDSGLVTFRPQLESYTEQRLQTPLQLNWALATTQGEDSSTLFAPAVYYRNLGAFAATLSVRSVYGCALTQTDTITVAAKPKARISAIAAACVNTLVQVTDTAAQDTGNSWLWQWGDGRTANNAQPEPFAYEKPGVYQLTLFKQHENGCADTARHRLVIDQLSANMTVERHILCDSGWAQLQPRVESFAATYLEDTLQYRWTLTHAAGMDSSRQAHAAFYVNKPAWYGAALEVQSAYGCVASAFDSLQVLETPKVFIDAPAAVCAGETVRFAGSTNKADPITWAWNLGGPAVPTQQAAQQFTQAGNFPVSLIAFTHPACPGTAQTNLVVHPLPQINLAPRDSTICRFDSFMLRANDAIQYTWTANGGTAAGNVPQFTVSPEKDTRYHVKAINQFGCVAADSTQIRVSQPFTITAIADKDSLCINRPLSLKVSGAVSYRWLNSDITNAGAAELTLLPQQTATYTVVGYGADHCFTDTARLPITVIPLPQVDAGKDTTVFWRSSVSLMARTSPDVTSLLWSPSTSLSCASCPNPVSIPEQNMEYRLIAKNFYGCIALDTVRIRLQCASNAVYLPNAFTPNNDGKNDVFYPMGGGVRNVRYFRVFNRWGDLVFEQTNIAINDRNSGWDGTMNGQKLPPENYVWTAELVCPEGQPFQLKGMVLLIR